MLNNNIKLEVDYVVSPAIDGYVRVFVSNTLFNAVKQSLKDRFNNVPSLLSFSGGTDKDGLGIREFLFGDIKLYVSYDKATSKNEFFISAEDAHTLGVKQYERTAGTVVAPFAASAFRNIATA